MATGKTTEHDPVALNEQVLRRIHRNHYHEEHGVSVGAFSPRETDTDGLSVFRELFSSPATVGTTGRQPGSYYVARLQVDCLARFELSVVPHPVAGGPQGHAVIPEMNYAAFQQKETRRKFKEIRKDLAEIATEAIAYRPE